MRMVSPAKCTWYYYDIRGLGVIFALVPFGRVWWFELVKGGYVLMKMKS